MADRFRFILDSEGSVLRQTLVEQGDGSYAPLVASEKSEWLSIVVVGKTRDPSKDMEQQFGDGTVQTIYFDVNADFAGRSERVAI